MKFCEWVLNLLGYEDGDTLDDLFPETPTPKPAGIPAPMIPNRQLVNALSPLAETRAVPIVVLGDSTGDGSDEWVYLTAQGIEFKPPR